MVTLSRPHKLLQLLPKEKTSLALDVDSATHLGVSTGSLFFDSATGFNGYPIGGITELFGKESSWKTTLALHAVKQAQAMPGSVVWIDTECTFNRRYASRLGVDLSQLIVIRPCTAEEAFDLLQSIVNSKEASLVVLDSLAALTPRVEIENSIELKDATRLSELLARALPKLLKPCKVNACTLLFLNQLRFKTNVVFGSPKTTPGGQALRHYASLRVSTGGPPRNVNFAEIDHSRKVNLQIVKSKGESLSSSVEVCFAKDGAIDEVLDTIAAAIELGVICLHGGEWHFNQLPIGIRSDAIFQAIKGNDALRAKIRQAVFEFLENQMNQVPHPILRKSATTTPFSYPETLDELVGCTSSAIRAS